jgi:hypothetical protein
MTVRRISPVTCSPRRPSACGAAIIIASASASICHGPAISAAGDEVCFNETRDTGFLLGCLDQLWPRLPSYKPLSVGVVLLDLVPASQHQPDLFDAVNQRRQKLSPMIDRINDRYGRRAIGFGLLPPDVRAFKGHAAFHRVPESWEF